MKKIQYVVRCSFCNSEYIVPEYERDYICSHCGATNSRADIIETLEQEIDNGINNQYAASSKKSTKYLAFLAIIPILLFVGLIALSINGDISKEKKKQQLAYEKYLNGWKQDSKNTEVQEEVEALSKALSDRDYEAIMNCMYLPEGSVCDYEAFEKAITSNQNFSNLFGKKLHVQRILLEDTIESEGTREYTIDFYEDGFELPPEEVPEDFSDDQPYPSQYEISIKYKANNGGYQIYDASLFCYDYKIKLRSGLELVIDGNTITEDYITEDNTDTGKYVIYTIPAIISSSHSATCETVFGTVKKNFEPETNNNQDDLEMWFSNSDLSDISAECKSQMSKFMILLTKVAYNEADISQLYEYFTEDYSKELLEEQVNTLKRVVAENPGRISSYNKEATITLIYVDSSEEVGIGVYYHMNDYTSMISFDEHILSGLLKLTKVDGKIKIASMKDDELFNAADAYHVNDFPW